MKNEDKSILDEGDFWKKKELTNRQLASLVQSKVRYPNYILAKIDAIITERSLDKNDLRKEFLLEKNTNTVGENFILFYKKNKIATISLSLFCFVSLFATSTAALIIIFSIYFSLKRFSK